MVTCTGQCCFNDRERVRSRLVSSDRSCVIFTSLRKLLLVLTVCCYCEAQTAGAAVILIFFRELVLATALNSG